MSEIAVTWETPDGRLETLTEYEATLLGEAAIAAAGRSAGVDRDVLLALGRNLERALVDPESGFVVPMSLGALDRIIEHGREQLELLRQRRRALGDLDDDQEVDDVG